MPKNNGQITVATAKKRFVEYYDNNRNKKNGKERGKKLDMMYKKKPAFSYKCNITKKNIKLENGFILKPGLCEPGSEKFLLEKGPKTFDLEGIDSFEKGVRVKVPGVVSNNPFIISKGYPNNKNIGKKYKQNIDAVKYGKKKDGTIKHLVDLSWEKQKKGELKIKNKKGWQLTNIQKNVIEDYSSNEIQEGIYVITEDYEPTKRIYVDNLNNTFIYEWDEDMDDYLLDFEENNGIGKGNIDAFLSKRGLTRKNIKQDDLF